MIVIQLRNCQKEDTVRSNFFKYLCDFQAMCFRVFI